jgi:hypothetical protein
MMPKHSLTKYLLSWVDNYAVYDMNYTEFSKEEIAEIQNLADQIRKCNPNIIDCIVDDMLDCVDDVEKLAENITL